MKFHINNKGEAGRCKALLGKCPYGDETAHYPTAEDAQKAFENTQSNATIKTIKKEVATESKLSADYSTAYASWALLHDHLHNGTAVGNDAEIFYYSSPAGRLELMRRMSTETPGSPYAHHHRILEQIEANEVPQLVLSAEEEKDFEEKLAIGTAMVEDNAKSEKVDFDTFKRVDRNLGAYLISKSSEWLERLSIEEQETISHATSNGFYYVGESLSTRENISSETRSGFKSYLTNELKKLSDDFDKTGDCSDDAYDAHQRQIDSLYKENAHAFTERLKTAVAKAPRLEKPIKIYRGIKLDELDSLNRSGVERDEFVSELLSGKHTGERLSRENASPLYKSSKLAHAPLSATANPQRALQFAEFEWRRHEKQDEETPSREFIYEIEARTVASPVAVSAWGVGEAEVFTNHESDYEISGAYVTYEKRHQVIVVKLREILAKAA